MTSFEWDILLNRSPCDWALREGYALWLQDEAGDVPGAETQRWMARWYKAPKLGDAGLFPWNRWIVKPRYYGNPSTVLEKWEWWWVVEEIILPDPSTCCTLSEQVFLYFRKLERCTNLGRRFYCDFHTRLEAEKALQESLLELRLIGIPNSVYAQPL